MIVTNITEIERYIIEHMVRGMFCTMIADIPPLHTFKRPTLEEVTEYTHNYLKDNHEYICS